VNLTVGAVSKRITDLELYLGTALFYRHARGVIPTSAGVILAERASHMLIAFEDMRTEINKRSDDTKELASSPPTPELRRTASSQP
jgi:DNA-binding transcriptional LysR family regulator